MEALLDEGHSQKEVAGVIGKSPAAVSRERKRRKKRARKYRAGLAQQKANAKRASSKYCGMAMESHRQRRSFIVTELEAHRSPDEIAGRIGYEKTYPPIGKDAIYSWLYSTRGGRYAKHLCTRRRKKKPQKKSAKRTLIPNRIPLRERPKRGIHGQGDTFLSKKKDGTAAGVVIVVPEAHLVVGTKIADLKPRGMKHTINRIVTPIRIDDLTLDNGIENTEHEGLSIPAYFCEAHHPWEKPDVENMIGLLRRWFIPKGTNMNDVSEDDLQGYLHILNDKYRKSLGYRNAYEVALKKGIITKSFVERKTLAAQKHMVTRVALGVRI